MSSSLAITCKQMCDELKELSGLLPADQPEAPRSEYILFARQGNEGGNSGDNQIERGNPP